MVQAKLTRDLQARKVTAPMASQVRSPMVADVGARIRSLRTAKGLTQAQLAEPQYTKAYISMLESGRTRASMKALEHIAGALGVKPSDLLGGSAGATTPQYELIEARSLVEQGKPAEAVALLERLEDGLSAADQLMRLRYLAIAYNGTGQSEAGVPGHRARPAHGRSARQRGGNRPPQGRARGDVFTDICVRRRESTPPRVSRGVRERRREGSRLPLPTPR